GCGDPSARTYPVFGTVTFEGKPVETGYITFDPADGAAGTVNAPINDGKYELQAKAGKKKVSILAYRDRPGVKLAGGRVPRDCYIPTRYNPQPILTADVTPDGENRFDFPLMSK